MKTVKGQHAALAAHYILFAAVGLEERIDLCVNPR